MDEAGETRGARKRTKGERCKLRSGWDEPGQKLRRLRLNGTVERRFEAVVLEGFFGTIGDEQLVNLVGTTEGREVERRVSQTVLSVGVGACSEVS